MFENAFFCGAAAALVSYAVMFFSGRKNAASPAVRAGSSRAAGLRQILLAPVFCTAAAAAAGWSAFASAASNPVPIIIFMLITALALVYALMCAAPAGEEK
jgi:hypothetical protein